MNSSSPAYWAIVPAAGRGTRMGMDIPKQYLSLHGKTVIEHTLQRLLQCSWLCGIVVAINPYDEHWEQLSISRHPKIGTVKGGHERSDSVLNGLRAIEGRVDKLDWVLVHDAARPCIHPDSIQTLRDELDEHLVGGVLGTPVSDTIKQINAEYAIDATLDRNLLWQAQTPQMFRFGVLKEAIERSVATPYTDEASALEAIGYCPLMIEGRRDNIKITRVEDLTMAEVIVQVQETLL